MIVVDQDDDVGFLASDPCFDRQKNILVHEGLPLLGVEGHRMDVAAWLQGLGLERYMPAFRDNEIDWDALPKLSAEDLKDLGVVLGGHRRRLLDAIAALGAAVPAASATAAPRDAPAPAEAERRQLTVMFCDLVGSTALSARLDPEDLREIIAAYHRAVAEVVAEFDGFVAKYMGDGVLVYFGYPPAHEDDAERAVRAGLGAIEAVGRLDVKSVALQARVGIATGLVVVGDLIGEGSAQEQSVVGETPNLAARLQGLAEPDAVLIAAGTRPAGRRPLRVPRPRRRRGEGHRRAGAGLAGAAAERRRKPVRGLAWIRAEPADRP
jgi:class 3 adenylate cyclase